MSKKLSDDGRAFFWQVYDALARSLPHEDDAESLGNIYKRRIKFRRNGKTYTLTIKES